MTDADKPAEVAAYWERLERILFSQQFYMNDPRGNYLWYTYRLTRQRVVEMMHAQRGYCKCCGHDLDGEKWAIDHKKGTFLIRGITCYGCNTGIGKLGDSVLGLMKAVVYLKQFEDAEYARLQALQHPVVKAEDSGSAGATPTVP